MSATGMVRLGTEIALTPAPTLIRGYLRLFKVMLVILMVTPLGGTQQNMALVCSLSTRWKGKILVLFAWTPKGYRGELWSAVCTSKGAVSIISGMF